MVVHRGGPGPPNLGDSRLVATGLAIVTLLLALLPEQAQGQASFCRLLGPDKCVGKEYILQEQVSGASILALPQAARFSPLAPLQTAMDIGLHNITTGSYPYYMLGGMAFGDIDGDGDADALLAASNRCGLRRT